MHIVRISIDKRSIERDEYGRAYTDARCKVALIRLYKAIKDSGLKEAKDAVEAVYEDPQYGSTFTFICDDGDLGRLYLFLRENHAAIVDRDRSGYMVREVQTFKQGVLA